MLDRLGFPPESHAGKSLVNVLDTFPRDELFQIGADDLARLVEGILDLELRPRVRVFARVDRFDRFVSVLVYAPRDRYSTRVRERIGAYLADAYNGYITAFYPYFTEGQLVRVHFIVGRTEGATPQIPTETLERDVAALVKTWQDGLVETLRARWSPAVRRSPRSIVGAFSAGYAETFTPARALEDIERIERLGAGQAAGDRLLHRDPRRHADRLRAAVYRFDAPIRLSERVPVLENLGFSVIDERTYEVTPRFDAGARDCRHPRHGARDRSTAHAIDIRRCDLRLEDAFLAVLTRRDRAAIRSTG